MNSSKQGVASIVVIALLGLAIPASFDEPAFAKKHNTSPQPMAVTCDLDGKSDNGFEYETEVNSVDKGNDLGTMRDRHSDLVLTAVAGYLDSTYTAIEDNKSFDQDDSSPYARVPLDAGDARLAGGYPVTFEIPRGYPFEFEIFPKGARAKALKKYENLAECVASDLGILRGREAKEVLRGTQCLANGVMQDECYQNTWTDPSKDDVKNSKPCVALGDDHYDKCMASGVTYHYQDDYHVLVTVKHGRSR